MRFEESSRYLIAFLAIKNRSKIIVVINLTSIISEQIYINKNPVMFHHHMLILLGRLIQTSKKSDVTMDE